MAHGDYTGQNKQVLAQRFAQQQQLAAQNMSLVSQVVTEARQDVVDLRVEEDLVALRVAENPGADEDGVTQVSDPGQVALFSPVKFKASETLEQVTVGRERNYNLEAGQAYIAPRWVVKHLDEKGLVWH